MTKKDKFMAIVEFIKGAEVEMTSDEMVEFLEHEVELLSKKRSTSGERKPTKTQIENEGIKAQIVELLAASDEGMQAGAIAKELDISPNKATALLTQLSKAGTIVREKVGKTVLFSAE